MHACSPFLLNWYLAALPANRMPSLQVFFLGLNMIEVLQRDVMNLETFSSSWEKNRLAKLIGESFPACFHRYAQAVLQPKFRTWIGHMPTIHFSICLREGGGEMIICNYYYMKMNVKGTNKSRNKTDWICIWVRRQVGAGQGRLHKQDDTTSSARASL